MREILLLDEIFAVGDAGFNRKCEARFRELQAAGHTIVIVSHNPRAIAEFCDRAILIEAGRIVSDSAPGEVCRQYLDLLSADSPQG